MPLLPTLPIFQTKPSAEVKKLWATIIEFYYILNSNYVNHYVSESLSDRDKKIFERAIVDLESFLSRFSKSVGIKFDLQKERKKKKEIKTLQAGKFINQKLKILKGLIIKRNLPFSLEKFIRHLATGSLFKKAKRSFGFFLAKMTSINWKDYDVFSEPFDIRDMNEREIKDLISNSNVQYIREEIFPNIDERNITKVLNALSAFPKKAYNEKVIQDTLQLFISRLVRIDNMTEIAGIKYWSNMPRARVKKVLSSLSENLLKKIAPFLNLTVKELESLNLVLDPKIIKHMAMSKYPAIRKFWISSQRFPVYPVLYIYNTLKWKLSKLETDLVNLYKNKLDLAKISLHPLNNDDWVWLPVSKVSKHDSGWRKFMDETMNYKDLYLEMIGSYFHETKHIYIPIYLTVYGNLDSTRDDSEILSFYAYKGGKSSHWNPNPIKDVPYNIIKKSKLFFKAFAEADKLKVDREAVSTLRVRGALPPNLEEGTIEELLSDINKGKLPYTYNYPKNKGEFHLVVMKAKLTKKPWYLPEDSVELKNGSFVYNGISWNWFIFGLEKNMRLV